MKTETNFVPADTLERCIQAGDFDGVIAALRVMPHKERKARHVRMRDIRERTHAAGWEKNGKIKAWWGGDPTSAQLEAARAALFFCGDAEARIEQWDWNGRLFPYLDMLEPAVLRGFAAELVLARPQFIATAQQLVVERRSDRPDSDAYIIGFIGAVRDRRGDENRILAMIAADPALLDGPLMRIFEVEGDGSSNMAALDKYSRGNHTWTYALQELIRTGKLTRAQLIERCLYTLEKDWPQFRAGWFSRFHDQLAPTPDEMAPLSARYLGLCHSRIAPTVALALNAVAVLFKEGRIGSAALLDALVPVMSSAVKGQVDAALKLLDQLVRKDAATAQGASALAQRALAHESPDLHKKVIARLSAWGFDETTRAGLAAMLPHVAAVHRAALAVLVGEAAAASDGQASGQEVLAAGVVAPMDASRKLAPLQDIDELVQTIAYVFENETAVDDFERALEALARLAPSIRSEDQRFHPVLKRAVKVLASDREIAGALARTLGAVVDGQLHTAGMDGRSSDGDLRRRIADLAVFVTRHGGQTPLSSATHQRGFIDPLALCERIAADARAGAESTLDEQVRALLRLPSGQAPAALAKLQQLAQTPFVQACRYALGDAVELGDEPALFLAAARIRHPDQDDARALAAFGDLGPDGAIAARYAWSVEVWTEYPVSHHIVVNVGPPGSNPDPGLIAIHRHGVGECEYFSWGEGNLLYAASILPSSLEAFFADGAYQIGRNTDWWEARWHDKAYLAVLMDPTVPVTPSALKMIALALGAKEAGQTALAIDAFVALLLEGRADALQVAGEIRWALLALIGKSARYAKTLASAARAHPSMPARVIAMLCAIVDIGPAAPPKDTGALLELLLELSVKNGGELPAGARDRIALLTLTGKGKAAQKELLARFR